MSDPSDLATLLHRLLTDEYGEQGWRDLGSLRRITQGLTDAGYVRPEPGLCGQCGEMPAVMVKIGTADGWCTRCLDEAAEPAAHTAITAALAYRRDAQDREALEAACLEGLVLTEHGYRYRPATGADAVERILATREAEWDSICEEEAQVRRQVEAEVARLREGLTSEAVREPIIRYAETDDGEEFDEFIAYNATVHFEAMGRAQWWAGVTLPDGRSWMLNFGAHNDRVKFYANCEPDQ